MPETCGLPEEPDWSDAVEFTPAYKAAQYRGLMPDAASVAAQDPRYLVAVRVVAPWHWKAAANDPRWSIEQVLDRLVRLGYDPERLPPAHAFRVDEDDEPVEFEVDPLDRPKGRPAALDGYRRTDGRPDRPSHTPEGRRRYRLRRKEQGL